jgi:quercetin 2,3-dioxygenase
MSKLRTIQMILPKPSSTHMVGNGFDVLPVFDKYAFTEVISPLLLFGYGQPTTIPPRPGQKPYGVGQHPHRGFETVTISFQGESEHKDSTGTTGIIRQGDVQWMTAGRGIIHEEYHSTAFTQTGGIVEMCQLWVNLPKQYKMTKPSYQSILNETIPIVQLPIIGASTNTDTKILGTARIIAGELDTTIGSAKTFSPVQVWDVSIPTSGSVIDLPFPPHQNLILFIRRGTIKVLTNTSDDDNNKNNNILSMLDVAIMKLDGSSDHVRFRTNENNTSVLVLGGDKLNEPIAAHGPFVMNTKEEIKQAIYDYQNGKMGR